MTSRQTDCPVCGHPGFERAALPQICPQCGWSVENLLEPSKAYLRKLNEAKEKWLTGGETQVRAKRLVALFEQIDAAWKAGRWTEVLGCYDEIQSIHPDNVRASNERPVALFCLMESLLLRYWNARRDELLLRKTRDTTSRDKLMADASQFESVGMAREADDLLEQAAVLEKRLGKSDAEFESLTSSAPGYFADRYQKEGPDSHRRDKSHDFASLLKLPKPKWTNESFHKLLWQPFLRQLPDLPVEERRYADEFRAAYENVAPELILRESNTREALDEARRMVSLGCYEKAESCLAEAEKTDPSFSDEIDSVRATLNKRRQAAEKNKEKKRKAAEALEEERQRVEETIRRGRKLAARESAEERRRNLAKGARWVAMAGAGLVVLLGLVWAWSNLIVPFFGHHLWRPFSWHWYIKLPVGLVLAFVGIGLSAEISPVGNTIIRVLCVIIGLYGAALVVTWLLLFVTRDLWQPFKWEWYYRLFFGVILSFVGIGLSAAGEDSPPMLFVGIPVLLYGLALVIILVGSFLGWLFGSIF